MAEMCAYKKRPRFKFYVTSERHVHSWFEYEPEQLGNNPQKPI